MAGAKKVLIVEDELFFQKSLADKLTAAGFFVLNAQDGKEGLEMALAQKPDVIVLDIVMPVMDGVGMLQKLRQDEWGKQAKVVFLSNYLKDAERVLGLSPNENTILLLKTYWNQDSVVKKLKELAGA